MISQGNFTSVKIWQHLVFGAKRDTTGKACSYICVYNSSHNLDLLERIRLPCFADHLITLHISNANIYASCWHDDKVYVFTHKGKSLRRLSKYGQSDPGQFRGPFLCHGDINGALLFTDYDNKRLQILHNDETWSGVPLYLENPPDRAIYTPNRLYVSLFNSRLAMFEPHDPSIQHSPMEGIEEGVSLVVPSDAFDWRMPIANHCLTPRGPISKNNAYFLLQPEAFICTL